MTEFIVNTTYANLYKAPDFKSEMISQALLWEKLTAFEKRNDFYLVNTTDNYQGWVSETQIIASGFSVKDWKQVTSVAGAIYERANANGMIIRTTTPGCRIPVLEERKGWTKTKLPDRAYGWIKSTITKESPCLNRGDFIKLAKRFLGIPYVWGGKTVYGFDCSGLVQIVHQLAGINIRRDAWMQYEDADFVSDKPDAAQPGDLYFFSKDQKRVSHVGIALGSGLILHARGYVRINSVVSGQKDYDRTLEKDFVGIKTFLCKLGAN
ncbi:MAG: C40 family peptidase [Calditrichaceae bacterium]|nr:C40 family peptidase [Calditrichaceae bacterium]